MSRIVGHYAPWLLTAVLGSLIALTLVPDGYSYIPWQVLALVLVATVLMAVSVFAHNRRPCERCIASMPLDPSTVASRYTARFRTAHLFESKISALCYLAVLVGFSTLSSHPVGRYGWAAAQASLVYLLLAYVTHQRLRPWCPRCRNGGEEQAAPTVPTPVSTQP